MRTLAVLVLGVGVLCAGASAAAALRAGFAVSAVVRVLVVKATWGPEQFTDAEVSTVVFGAAARFIDAASFGRVRIAGTQTPWLHAYRGVPVCGPDALTLPAKAAAAVAGYDAAAYDRVIYLLPTMPNNCPRETADFRSGSVILIGNLVSGLVEHELGHTFGLSHAGALRCSLRSKRLRCGFDHYGDYLDVMGSGYLGGSDVGGNGAGDGDYGALQKACAGWLTDYTHVGGPGVYTVDALERPSALPQALVIDTASHAYWVDHREPLGNDAYLAGAPDVYAQATRGIEVHQAQRDAVQISELRRKPDYLLPNGGSGSSVTGPGSTFKLAGVFALDVLAHQGTLMTVRFRWIDHTRPTMPVVTAPHATVRQAQPVEVVWRRSRDNGTGVKQYVVKLDRQPAAIVPATTAMKTLRLALSPAIAPGNHRVTVLAIDYAGNHSKTATRHFVMR